MFFYGVFILVTIFNILPHLSCMPFVFDEDDDSNVRDKYKDREKPCNRNGEDGRTFFPVKFSYVNVNYNYDCRGNNQNVQADPVNSINTPSHHHRPHKPHGQKPHHHHHKPQQSQESKPGDISHDPIEDLHQQPPQRPYRPFMTFIENHIQGMGILHTIVNGIFGTTTEKPSSSAVIPVHEVPEDTVIEEATKWKPGQFVAAYNPLTGQYTQNVSLFNSKQLYRKINRSLDWFLQPIYDLL